MIRPMDDGVNIEEDEAFLGDFGHCLDYTLILCRLGSGMNPLFTGQISHGINVGFFGKPRDWSGIEASRDFVHSPHLDPRTHNIYAPTLGTGRRIVSSSSSWNGELVDGRKFFHGAEADAVKINPGNAVIMKPADCPITVLCFEHEVVVCHCGRDNMIDRNSPRRGRPSILADVMASATSPLRFAWISFGISREHFAHDPNHPEHGLYNQRMIDHVSDRRPTCVDRETGTLDLHELIREDLLQDYGVQKEKVVVFPFCPFTRTGSCWSHRRGDRQRNLVLVEYLY